MTDRQPTIFGNGTEAPEDCPGMRRPRIRRWSARGESVAFSLRLSLPVDDFWLTFVPSRPFSDVGFIPPEPFLLLTMPLTVSCIALYSLFPQVMNRKSVEDDVSDLPPIDDPPPPAQSQAPPVPEAGKVVDEGAAKKDTPKTSNTNKKKGGNGDRSEKLR